MIGSPLGTWTSKSVIWNSTTSHHKAISRWHRIGMVTTVLPFRMRQRRYFQNPDGFNFLEREQSYELEKNHSPWLRSSMRFRSIDCDGADERARWFDVPNGNARPSDVTFDGTHANAPRSHDEFTIGLPTLWQPRLQSK